MTTGDDTAEGGVWATLSYLENAPVLDGQELRLLGEIVAYGAMLEAVAAGIHGALRSDPNEPERESATTYDLQVGQLLKEIRNAGDNEAAAWADKSLAALSRRNLFVHTAWMIRAEFPAGHQAILGTRDRRSQPVSRAMTVDDLITARDACRDQYLSGLPISRRLHGM